MEQEQSENLTIANQIEMLADEILEISAGLNTAGESIACNHCSSQLIALASRLKNAVKKWKD